MIDYPWLQEKIRAGECADLDFKLECHQENSKLRHDILCLSNSPSKKDKYLIFGISDDEKIIGIEKPRSGVADIYVLLTEYMDSVPTLNLINITVEEVIVQVLTIKIDSFFRPYILNKDVQKHEYRSRQGVVYSRTGDRNTAYNKSAPLNIVEHLWKQRFGLDILPEEKIYLYLSDQSNWKYIDDSNEYIYMRDPDYSFKYIYYDENRVIIDIEKMVDLKWLDKSFNRQCPVYRDKISLMYRGRLFTNDQYSVFTSDNGTKQLVYPHEIVRNDFYHYYITGNNKDAANYNITLIINDNNISIDRMGCVNACDVYESHKEARDYLKNEDIYTHP